MPVIVIVILAVFGFFGVASVIMLPALARAREAARRASCQNNLKQIAICCKMFAAEHNKQFPESLQDLYPEYASDLEIFVCPSEVGAAVGNENEIALWTSYQFVPGLKDTDTEAAASTVLCDEREHNHVPNGKNLLFTDGHVEFQRE